MWTRCQIPAPTAAQFAPNLLLWVWEDAARWTLHAFPFNCVNGCSCPSAKEPESNVRKCEKKKQKTKWWPTLEVVAVVDERRNVKNENKAWGISVRRTRSELKGTLAELCCLRVGGGKGGGVFTLRFGDSQFSSLSGLKQDWAHWDTSARALKGGGCLSTLPFSPGESLSVLVSS